MMYVKYMIGWCLMEVGPIASGLGFNGYDEKGQAKEPYQGAVDTH